MAWSDDDVAVWWIGLWAVASACCTSFDLRPMHEQCVLILWRFAPHACSLHPVPSGASLVDHAHAGPSRCGAHANLHTGIVIWPSSFWKVVVPFQCACTQRGKRQLIGRPATIWWVISRSTYFVSQRCLSQNELCISHARSEFRRLVPKLHTQQWRKR